MPFAAAAAISVVSESLDSDGLEDSRASEKRVIYARFPSSGMSDYFVKHNRLRRTPNYLSAILTANKESGNPALGTNSLRTN